MNYLYVSMEPPPTNLRWQDVQQISFTRLTISATNAKDETPTVYEFPSIEEMVDYYQEWD